MMVPVVYIVPFAALGAIAFLTCLVLPSLRRYALCALIAPTGFGFGTLTGFIICVVLFALTGYRQNATSNVLIAFGSIEAGAIGAWVAVILVKLLGVKKALPVSFWKVPRRD